MSKKDIQTRNDIKLMVDTFYDYVNQSDILGFIFNDLAQVNWGMHLPKMYSFWASMLLGEQSFSGNPMQIHIMLSFETDMSTKQFNEWLYLFNKTIDELFEGEIANEAKLRASRIASNFQRNIAYAQAEIE